MAVCSLVSSQQPKPPSITKTTIPQDGDTVLRDLISARGIEHWSETQILMGLTSPPSQPVHPIVEWENARGVMFALDSDITGSLDLNLRTKTVNNAASVYGRRPQLVEALNEIFCGDLSDDDDDDSDSSADAKAKAGKKAEDSGCNDGRLDKIELDRAFDRLAIAHDFLAMVSGLARFVDVLLLVNGDSSNELQLDKVADHLREFRAGAELLSSQHVYLIQTRFDSKWIRDYGPLFVWDSSGSLTVVDARYDPQATEQSDQVKALMASLKGLAGASQSEAVDDGRDDDKQGRLSDDEAPSVLATRFRQLDGTLLRGSPVSVVRPPIVLSGGDYMTDGQGTAFTSARTLRENGGNVEQLDINFRKYLGATKVVYLHPLPGQTVKHIDMFLQFAASNVILLGKFARMPESTDEVRLQHAASAALEENLRILRDHYLRLGRKVKVMDEDGFVLDPHAVNIVRIPLPPVSRPLFGLVERTLRAFYAARRDYDEHSTLLRLLIRFDAQAKILEEGSESLTEIEKEAAADHPVDEHDDEVLQAIKMGAKEMSSVITRYSALSGDEYEHESEAISKVAGSVIDAMDHLHALLVKDIDEHPLSPSEVGTALAGLAQLENTAEAFAEKVTADNEKDENLKSMSIVRLRTSSEELRKVEKLYRYGTDLYRTHLNMLQVRTPGLMVLAVPTYRDPAIHPEEEIATSRIKAVFSQLYGRVEVVPVPSDAFIRELGSVHCLTKVLPEGVEFVKSDWNRPPAVDQSRSK